MQTVCCVCVCVIAFMCVGDKIEKTLVYATMPGQTLNKLVESGLCVCLCVSTSVWVCRVGCCLLDIPTCDCSCKWNGKLLLWNFCGGFFKFLPLLFPAINLPPVHTYCTLPRTIWFPVISFCYIWMYSISFIAVPNIHCIYCCYRWCWSLCYPCYPFYTSCSLEEDLRQEIPTPCSLQELLCLLSVAHLHLELIDYLYKRYLLTACVNKSATCQILLSLCNIQKYNTIYPSQIQVLYTDIIL